MGGILASDRSSVAITDRKTPNAVGEYRIDRGYKIVRIAMAIRIIHGRCHTNGDGYSGPDLQSGGNIIQTSYTL